MGHQIEYYSTKVTTEKNLKLFISRITGNAYDKYPYGKPQTDEVARGSGNREYGCQRLREKLPNVRESLFLEPGIPIV